MTRGRTATALAALGLVALATAACAGDAPRPARAAGPFPDAACALLTDRTGLAAFLARLPPPAAEAVRERLADGGLPAAVFFLGTAPTAGYRVEIRSVRVRPGGTVEITVRHEAPPPDALVAQALTYPVAVRPVPARRLPEGLREVRFLTVDGRLLARARPDGTARPRPLSPPP